MSMYTRNTSYKLQLLDLQYSSIIKFCQWGWIKRLQVIESEKMRNSNTIEQHFIFLRLWKQNL